MSASNGKQAVVTVVFGSHAELLDKTFTSFRQNAFLEMHAFIIGERLPANRIPGIYYHLKEHDSSFSNYIRDADFRRWQFIDDLDVEFALIVDGLDVFCLQPIPEISKLLRGGAVGGVIEHPGGRYLEGGLYCGNFLNAGVTFWNVPKSRNIRQEIIERGKIRYRNDVDDQLSLNEVIYCKYLDQLTILPCIYNFRAYLRRRVRGWPTCQNFDGVKIYHHDEWFKAKEFLPVKSTVGLPHLPLDNGPLSPSQQFCRKFKQRIKKHLIK